MLPNNLLEPVSDLLRLVSALGLELDGLSETAHPLVHQFLMLHLTDRIAKVNRKVRSTLLASLSSQEMPPTLLRKDAAS
jgi:hypothetical protein